MDQFVTIELFGQSYTFKAEIEAAKAREVADLLVREVNKIQDQQAAKIPHISKLTIVIIAALGMAHQILQLESGTGEMVGHISKRCEALNLMLDEGLSAFASLRNYG